MKFLIDMPASPDLVAWLQERGHETVHAKNINLETASDSIIMNRAATEERIVITANLDFGTLLAQSKRDTPGVILFRGGNYSEAEMRELVARVLETVKPDALKRSIAIVDKRRIRVTRLPLKKP
ncbi:MAG: DUF5615 family PIN-like protein [Anaerolineales bacterium]|nr:DUF5615 family PIN-like protein [Anaerolineales bacterium]HNQ93179.1 DUF5615 family PIN-like protein [Anaerolineales bacterium]